ncbi:hypothetical protein OG786_14365 [Streptomyces sp. NBC_00101]|uniref:hypothetical protein n=1 Tax=Streptomyces sp. NBC_00101 TaxID=2975651 RepID=UPI0032552555
MGRTRWLGRLRRSRTDAAALLGIDADITAFGEELGRHVLAVAGLEPEVAALTLQDYERALEAYERAKREFTGDRDLEDAADVIRTLAEGRHALACASARAAALPLPVGRPPCFFDPRHGPSTTDVSWAPPGGAPRRVAVCAADAVRIGEGEAPIATGRTRDPVPAVRPAAGGARGVRAAVPRDVRAVDRVDPRPVPGPPPASGRGANWRPYRNWPPGNLPGQRAEGARDRIVDLIRPDASRPVILVVRLSASGAVHLPSRGGRSGGRPLLKQGGSLRRTVVPLPPDGAGSVRVAVETHGTWRMWLAPFDEHVAPLADGLHNRGSYVFRHDGGPATVRVDQHDGGAFWLDELSEAGIPGRRLVTGKGSFTEECRLHGPGLLHVHSASEWRVRLVRSD